MKHRPIAKRRSNAKGAHTRTKGRNHPASAHTSEAKRPLRLPAKAIRANWDALDHNKATIPEIAYPLYYQDRSFTCRDCGSKELWRATQQKWWYEVAKGPIGSVAIRCRACRRKERERVAKAREAEQAGRVRKQLKASR